MCTCSQFLQCVCVDCCLLGGWVGPWTVFLGDWWALSFSPSLMLTLSAFLPFFSAGFQCLSLLLLPPCPSWLHRYLWLALWPGCRRAVSEEAKTHTHSTFLVICANCSNSQTQSMHCVFILFNTSSSKTELILTRFHSLCKLLLGNL